MLFTTQKLYCNGCGKLYDAFCNDWYSSLARARVCSRECKNRVELAYACHVMGLPDEANSSDQPNSSSKPEVER